MFTAESKRNDDEEDDDHIGGGFYAHDFESMDQFSLDLDASYQHTATDQFIDTKHLTSSHVLSPPETENGKSFVQHAQEQFNAGENLKFIDGVKAKQHFSLAALYFQRAAEGVTDRTVSSQILITSPW